ncbi:MAG TPA: hypothetical protein VIY29_02320 [Ktedonobacteraceae bacterium]
MGWDGVDGGGVVLPLARASDGGRVTPAAVCQRQLALGAEQVTRAPKSTKKESEDAYVYIKETRYT